MTGRAVALSILLTLCGCAVTGTPQAPPVLATDKSNAVATWHDIGAATVTAKSPGGVTDAEKFGAFPFDLATLHLAIYDAAMAIDRRYRPFLFAPDTDPGASVDAATATAAYYVLQTLFPSRAAHYWGAYERFMAAIPESDSKARGIALGKASAAAHLERRAQDGRAVTLPPYAENPAPGRFRGSDPINRFWPRMRPFTLASMNQFRPAPPPALDSAQYAADFNEVKELGGKDSTRRTPEQLELARFYSEPPAEHFTRNFGRFARSESDPVRAARLLAILYTGYSDAISACLEAKYHYDAWRPRTAIPQADKDNNPATAPEPGWTPVLPSPNHPEYPAAHACSTGALGELLRGYYGTDKVTFTWDSKVTNTTRTYADTDALAAESTLARIYGGMHFRYSTTAGVQLGKQVAEWTMSHAFQPVSK
jgi:PAP2 superfamily